jgi:hypothetical protein
VTMEDQVITAVYLDGQVLSAAAIMVVLENIVAWTEEPDQTVTASMVDQVNTVA